MAVITITSEMASGGRNLGRLLAERLDYRYVDKYLFQKIVEDLDVSEGTLESFEKKRRYEGYDKSRLFEEEYEKSLKSNLARIAQEDNVVIIGRAAYIFLKDMQNCYHIRLVAAMDWRKKYALENYKISQDEVQNFIEKGDRERRWFRRSFCGIVFDDSLWFHLTLNMNRTSIAKAVELIMSVAKPSG